MPIALGIHSHQLFFVLQLISKFDLVVLHYFFLQRKNTLFGMLQLNNVPFFRSSAITKSNSQVC